MDLKYYIFNTEKEAKKYDKDVTALKNYAYPSDNWANPIKHPTLKKWAVEASEGLVLEDREPQDLTEDWTPQIEN